MNNESMRAMPSALGDDEDDGPGIGLTEALTWIGEGKRLIAVATLIAAVGSVAVGLLLPKTYTARATLIAQAHSNKAARPQRWPHSARSAAWSAGRPRSRPTNCMWRCSRATACNVRWPSAST